MVKKITGIGALLLASLIFAQLLIVNFTTLPIPSLMFSMMSLLLPLLVVLLLATVLVSDNSCPVTLIDKLLIVVTLISIFVEVGYFFAAHPFMHVFFHTILRFLWMLTIPLLLLRSDRAPKTMRYIVLTGGILSFTFSCMQIYISGVLDNTWYLSDYLQKVIDVSTLWDVQSSLGIANRLITCAVLVVIAIAFLTPARKTKLLRKSY